MLAGHLEYLVGHENFEEVLETVVLHLLGDSQARIERETMHSADPDHGGRTQMVASRARVSMSLTASSSVTFASSRATAGAALRFRTEHGIFEARDALGKRFERADAFR